MRTLILDTSGAFSTVVVAEDADVLGSSMLRARPATHLHEQIRTLTRHLDAPLSTVSQIGIVLGPGSWTGLNIGVTAAKTLAQVLTIPVIPIKTLDALVATRRWHAGRICGLLHAGRQRIYYAWYLPDDQGLVTISIARTDVLAFSTWAEQLDTEAGQPLVIEYGHTFDNSLRELAPAIAPEHRMLLSPEALVAVLNIRKSKALADADLLALAPDYIQASLAERDASR